MFLCLSFTEQCFLRIRKFLTGWYTGSRCCCSTKTTLQNRSNLYQTVDMLPVICFSHLFLFQLAVCFERQYIFKQFIFLCIAYMVYFNLSCMAHTLGKFTLVRSSYCVFTLFFACVRYQKKKKWDGIYPPPFFFYTEDEENNTIKQWLGFRYTKPQSDVQLTRITNTLYGCHQLLSFSQKQRWSVHGFRGHLVSTTMTNLFLCEKTKESLISLINNIHILWNQNMMHRGL